MKKKIKNLAVVAIALFGFAIIGTNLASGTDAPYPDPGDGGGNDCSSWGYKRFNVWYSGGDGVDCNCNDREQVWNNC